MSMNGMNLGFDVSDDWSKDDGNYNRRSNPNKTYENPKKINRVGEEWEFGLGYGESSSIQLIDDVTLLQNQEVLAMLIALGFPQGPFHVKEHGMKNKEGWFKRYPCAHRNWEVDPVKRLYFANKCGSWGKISAALSEDASLADPIFMQSAMCRRTLEGMLSDKQQAALEDVVSVKLGDRLACPVCDADSWENRPSKTAYMTVVHVTEFETKNGDVVKNPIRLLRLSSKGLEGWQALATTVGAFDQSLSDIEIGLKRETKEANDKAPRSGGAPSMRGKLKSKTAHNEQAQYPLTVQAIQDRLDDDNQFYRWVWKLTFGQEPDAKNIVSKLQSHGLKAIPWTVDYSMARLPLTSTYLLERELDPRSLKKDVDNLRKLSTKPVQQKRQPTFEPKDLDGFDIADDDIPF